MATTPILEVGPGPKGEDGDDAVAADGTVDQSIFHWNESDGVWEENTNVLVTPGGDLTANSISGANVTSGDDPGHTHLQLFADIDSDQQAQDSNIAANTQALSQIVPFDDSALLAADSLMDERITTNSGAIANLADFDDSDLLAADIALGALISNNDSDIAALQAQDVALAGVDSNLNDLISNNDSDIAALDTRIGSNTQAIAGINASGYDDTDLVDADSNMLLRIDAIEIVNSDQAADIGQNNSKVSIPAGGGLDEVLVKTGAGDYSVGWAAQTGGSSYNDSDLVADITRLDSEQGLQDSAIAANTTAISGLAPYNDSALVADVARLDSEQGLQDSAIAVLDSAIGTVAGGQNLAAMDSAQDLLIAANTQDIAVLDSAIGTVAGGQNLAAMDSAQDLLIAANTQGVAALVADDSNQDLLIAANTSDISDRALKTDVLELTNTTPFTPTAPDHPVTKAYADNLSSASNSYIESARSDDGPIFLAMVSQSLNIPWLWDIADQNTLTNELPPYYAGIKEWSSDGGVTGGSETNKLNFAWRPLDIAKAAVTDATDGNNSNGGLPYTGFTGTSDVNLPSTNMLHGVAVAIHEATGRDVYIYQVTWNAHALLEFFWPFAEDQGQVNNEDYNGGMGWKTFNEGLPAAVAAGQTADANFPDTPDFLVFNTGATDKPDVPDVQNWAEFYIDFDRELERSGKILSTTPRLFFDYNANHPGFRNWSTFQTAQSVLDRPSRVLPTYYETWDNIHPTGATAYYDGLRNGLSFINFEAAKEGYSGTKLNRYSFIPKLMGVLTSPAANASPLLNAGQGTVSEDIHGQIQTSGAWDDAVNDLRIPWVLHEDINLVSTPPAEGLEYQDSDNWWLGETPRKTYIEQMAMDPKDHIELYEFNNPANKVLYSCSHPVTSPQLLFGGSKGTWDSDYTSAGLGAPNHLSVPVQFATSAAYPDADPWGIATNPSSTAPQSSGSANWPPAADPSGLVKVGIRYMTATLFGMVPKASNPRLTFGEQYINFAEEGSQAHLTFKSEGGLGGEQQFTDVHLSGVANLRSDKAKVDGLSPYQPSYVQSIQTVEDQTHWKANLGEEVKSLGGYSETNQPNWQFDPVDGRMRPVGEMMVEQHLARADGTQANIVAYHSQKINLIHKLTGGFTPLGEVGAIMPSSTAHCWLLTPPRIVENGADQHVNLKIKLMGWRHHPDDSPTGLSAMFPPDGCLANQSTSYPFRTIGAYAHMDEIYYEERVFQATMLRGDADLNQYGTGPSGTGATSSFGDMSVRFSEPQFVIDPAGYNDPGSNAFGGWDRRGGSANSSGAAPGWFDVFCGHPDDFATPVSTINVGQTRCTSLGLFANNIAFYPPMPPAYGQPGAGNVTHTWRWHWDIDLTSYSTKIV
jgi:hypothetical protein